MIAAYHSRLTSSDNEVRRKAAHAWSRWEMATSRLHSDPDMLSKADSDEFADVFARIEAHYFVNGGASLSPLSLPFPTDLTGFIREGQLLEKAEIDKVRARIKSPKLTPSDPPHPRCVPIGSVPADSHSDHRPGPIRLRLPGDLGVGPAPRVARGQVHQCVSSALCDLLPSPFASAACYVDGAPR